MKGIKQQLEYYYDICY